MKTTMFAIVATAALLAGCQDTAELADPPSDEEMGTSDAAPTTADVALDTQAPPDDVEQTSAAPEESAAAPDGPPEMPEVAREDSEAGAAAFAAYYLEVLNYSTMAPESGLLSPLSDDSCKACASFEDMIDEYARQGHRTEGPVITYEPFEARDTGDNMVIFADAEQPVPATVDQEGKTVQPGADPSSFTMVIRLKWMDEGWKLIEIQAG